MSSEDRKLIEDFIALLDSHGRRSGTLAVYRRDLEQLSQAKGPLLRITTGDLREFMHQRGGSPATRARRHTAIRRFFDYQVEIGAVSANPIDGIPRPKVAKRHHPEVVHVNSVLEDLPGPARLVAEFVLETGLRKGELTSISVGHSVRSQIVVEGRERRVVNLSPRGRQLLQELGGSIFRRMSVRSVQRHLKEVDLSLEVLRKIALRTAPSRLPLHPWLDVRIRRLVDHRESEEAVFNASFGTISHLAGRVAGITGMTEEAVLRHIAGQTQDAMTRQVAEMALSVVVHRDADRFNRLREEASKAEDFAPAIFRTITWLAEQIALAEGTSAKEVLEEMATIAAMGEAGLFDDQDDG